MPSQAELAMILRAKDEGVKAVFDSTKGAADNWASGIGSSVGKVVSGFSTFGLAAQGIQTAIEGIKGIGSVFGIGALSEMEQTRASFQAFTKDAGLTEQIMADVRKEAALTPFAFGEMAKATASLMPVAKSSGLALMDLVKEAEILGASNPMEGLEGASFALKEAISGDFTSIIERFNLSRSSINKWKEEGVPNIEIVRRAMKEMGLDSDLIAAKAETLDGRWSTFQDTLQTLQMRMGQPIFDVMKEGLSALQPVLDDNMEAFESFADFVAGGLKSAIETGKTALRGLGEIVGRVFSGDLAGAADLAQEALANIGEAIATGVEEWAGAFVSWLPEVASGWGTGLGELAASVNDWILDSAIGIVEQFGTWAGAFLDWIGPLIPPLLRELGGYLSEMWGWMGGTALPKIVSTLAEWGLALVEWVAPRIPPLLAALADLLVELGTWIVTTALPAIVLKLGEWASAFVDWVPGAALRLLLALGEMELKLLDWLILTALPAIVLKLNEWANAIVDWVNPASPKLLLALGQLGADMLGWIAQKAVDVATAALDLGKGMVGGIQNGISGALQGFWSWLQTNFVDRIPGFVRELLGIHSPSGVFADIGRNIVDGLRVGMEARLPSIDDIVSRMVGTIATAGEVTDWLRAAMQVTGVGGDWLAGLQRLVGWESSGNPRSVNPTAVGGQHATGLLQTLPSTFRHFARQGMGDIFNPIHNAVAAIKYIQATYGHVNRIPGIRSGNRGEFPGYATGGIAWQPQLAMLAEREPELIVPLSRLRGNGGGRAPMQVMRVDVAIGGRVARQIVVEGYDLAVRQGWTPGGLTG